MKFLNHKQRSKLQEILIKNNYLKTTDAGSRRVFLENCDLEKYCTLVELDKPLSICIPILCNRLSEIHIEVDEQKKIGLIVFLENIILSDFLFQLIEEEKLFIKHVIQKGEAWEKRNQIKNSLAQGRQNSSQTEQSQPPVKIDRKIIINFDLTTLVSKFSDKVQYEGAFAFSVGGDATLLREYIIERIKRELEIKTDRDHQPLDVHLYHRNILNHKQIEQEFVKQHNDYECLTDIFTQVDTDVMLIVWNYDIPQKVVKQLAEPFWIEVKQSVLPFLTSQGRCFVLIWANLGMKVGRSSLQEFTVLSTPNKFDLNDLSAWFRGQLKQQGVPKNRIDSEINGLLVHDGNLLGTYHQMNQIIQRLQQGGERLYG